jgi:hypothetical protein
VTNVKEATWKLVQVRLNLNNGKAKDKRPQMASKQPGNQS